jgi:cytidylate kinase
LQNGSQSADDAKKVLDEIAARDQRDRTRTASPLVPALDAVILDTTHMSIDEVVDEVEKIAKQRSGVRG